MSDRSTPRDKGATAFNRKLIDLAQRNLNSAFDLAKKLAGAKTFREILELQSTFIRSQFDVFANQAGEIRALTTKIAADTTEPIKHQMTRTFEHCGQAVAICRKSRCD